MPEPTIPLIQPPFGSFYAPFQAEALSVMSVETSLEWASPAATKGFGLWHKYSVNQADTSYPAGGAPMA